MDVTRYIYLLLQENIKKMKRIFTDIHIDFLIFHTFEHYQDFTYLELRFINLSEERCENEHFSD